MTWQARVEQSYGFQFDSIKVYMRDQRGDGQHRYLGYTDPVITTVPVEGAMRDEYNGLLIPEDAARALLDALLDHFRQTRADENVRSDYLAERARVDKLIDAMITPFASPSVRTLV